MDKETRKAFEELSESLDHIHADRMYQEMERNGELELSPETLRYMLTGRVEPESPEPVKRRTPGFAPWD
jgi:hypothetical protein